MNQILMTFVILLLFVSSALSQARINAFKVNPSNFIETLKSHKTTNPNQSIEEFVGFANEVLQKEGINFTFAFDADTCQKLSDSKEKQTDKSLPLNIQARLVSLGGDGKPTPVVLPEAKFDNSQCFSCYLQIPIFEITENTFVTSLMQTNIVFSLPNNFLTNEVLLVDENDSNKVLRKWRTPYLANPISVSDDGNVIYLPFPSDELKDLALVMFGQGTFSVVARKDIDSEVKIIPIQNSDSLNGANHQITKFQFEDNNQTLRFKASCQN